MDKLGQRVLVADGGSGGNSENDWKGSMGQTLSLNLELKLIADVGFVGWVIKMIENLQQQRQQEISLNIHVCIQRKQDY